eukprot:3888435-Prymnesium_polylepis.1
MSSPPLCGNASVARTSAAWAVRVLVGSVDHDLRLLLDRGSSQNRSARFAALMTRLRKARKPLGWFE